MKKIRKRQNCFFDQNDPDKLKMTDYSFNSKRILRDIIRGRIDVHKYGKIFFNINAFNPIYELTINKLREAECDYHNAEFVINYLQESGNIVPEILKERYDYHLKLFTIYSIVEIYLVKLYNEQDESYLFNIVSDIRNQNYNLNDLDI